MTRPGVRRRRDLGVAGAPSHGAVGAKRVVALANGDADALSAFAAPAT